MHYFHIYSNKSLIFSSNKYENFDELVNNTIFDFDYVDNYGSQVFLFKDSKLLNILI